MVISDMQETEENNSTNGDMPDELPPNANNLICERCASKTRIKRPNKSQTDNDATPTDQEIKYTVTCLNSDRCGYVGWVLVNAKTILELGGDMFWGDTHDAHREEPHVTYKEHYKVETGEDAPNVGDENPSKALTYTEDEIVAGFNSEVSYKCSCGRTYYSKTKLANHLLAVEHNKSLITASQSSN